MKNTSNIFIQSLIFSVVFAASSSVFADSFELGQIYAQPSQKGCVRDTPIGVGLTHTCFAPIANLVHATLLGFSTAEPLEISNNSWGIYFPNINQYANGRPGVYKLRIKVDIPDENGVIAESHTSDEIEIKLFSWDSVDYRFDDSCPPSITVTLNTSPEYDGNPAIVLGDTRGFGTSITHKLSDLDMERKAISFSVKDEQYGCDKNLNIPLNISDDGKAKSGDVRIDLGSIDFSLTAGKETVGNQTKILNLSVKADEWSESLFQKKSLRVDQRAISNNGMYSILLNGANRNDASGIFVLTNHPVTGFSSLHTSEGMVVATDRVEGDGYDIVAANRYHVAVRRYMPPANSGYARGMRITHTWLDTNEERSWIYLNRVNAETEAEEWALVSNEISVEKEEVLAASETERTTRRTISDYETGAVVSQVDTTDRKLDWGWSKVREVIDPNGEGLETRWHYAERGAGNYGHVTNRVDSDGVSAVTLYDTENRVAYESSPSPMGLHEVLNRYVPVDERDDGSVLPERPREIIEKVAGIVTAKRWNAFWCEDGEETIVEELAATQDAEYGDEGNLRTLEIRYVNAITSRFSGRPILSESADGQQQQYLYTIGEFSEGVFSTNSEGTVLRIETLRTHKSVPEGIPNQSVCEVSYEDLKGDEIFAETFVVTDGGRERISWTAVERDENGREIKRTNSDGAVVETWYDNDGNVVRAVATDGTTTENEYDDGGRVIAQKLKNTNGVTFKGQQNTYDLLGALQLSAQDVDLDGVIELGENDRAVLNESGYVKMDGVWWREEKQFTYPTAGSAEPICIRTIRQRLTGLGVSPSAPAVPLPDAFCLASETISIDSFGNETRSQAWRNRGECKSVTITQSPESTNPAWSVAVRGRTLETQSQTGVHTTYEYDGLGRMVAVTDGRGNTTSFTYDALGRQTKVTDASGAETTFGYDALGRQNAVTNALGQATHIQYDSQNRVIAQWGAEYPVVYEYDDYGYQTAMATFRDDALQNGDWTLWHYDESTGLLTNKVYADGNGTRYTYTDDGKVATRTWARGFTANYSYNSVGECTEIDYSDGTPTQRFTYDRQGNRISAIVDGVSTNLYYYSIHGQCTNEIQNGISIVRKYDTIGRNAGIDFHNLSITNHYDSLGRFSTVEANGMTFVYRYLANSDLVSGYETEDLVREVAYETNRDLIASVSSHFDERLISSFVYVNDSVGRRTAVEKDGEAFGALQGMSDGYGYNQRSEVVSARRTKGTDEIRGFSADYEYDPIGNRRTSALYDENNVRMESVYSANALNQYASRTIPGMVQIHGESVAGAVVDVNERPTFQTDGYFYGSAAVDNTESAVFAPIEVQSIIPTEEAGMLSQIYAETGSVFVAKTPKQFVYDLDGNMVQNGRFRFEWNGENRLVKAEELFAPTNREPMAVRYAYDHLGRMVRKEISTESGEPLKTITYLWDGYNIIQEVCNGQITQNVWGLDVDRTQQGAGGVGGLLAVVRDGTTYLPTYDANGNISEYINHTSGEVVAHYDYSPFGEQLIASYPLAHTFTHRFSTKPWCPITSLYEYQMRKYDPNLGRWMSHDPLEEEGGVNLYAMCGSNVIDVYDYLGQKCCLKIWDGIPGHMALKCDNMTYISKFPDGSKKKMFQQPSKWNTEAADRAYFSTIPHEYCFSCIDEDLVTSWYQAHQGEQYFWGHSSCIEIVLDAIKNALPPQKEKECSCNFGYLILGYYPYQLDLLSRSSVPISYPSPTVTPDMLKSNIELFINSQCQRFTCVYRNNRGEIIYE